MQFLILVLLILFIIFLYTLYYFSREDFVIVRKDIQMDRIFSLAILTFIVSAISARVFFIILNPSNQSINPLSFLSFTHIPGFSLIGGISAGSLFIYLYSRFRKIPAGKLFDLFTVSLTTVMPIGFIGIFVILLGKTNLFFNIMFVVSLIFFVIFNRFIYTFSIKGEIKDGTLGLIYLFIFSFAYFLVKLFIYIKSFSFLDPENILLLVMLFLSLIIFLNNEIIDKFLSKK